MKHSRSSAEVEIRDAVVARFRALMPSARIVHEMNVEDGYGRVDVAAIEPTRMTFCEIKSEKDKPDRLARQLHFFGPCCHTLILAAHAKWWISPGKEEKKRKDEAGRITSHWIRRLPSPMEELLAEFPHWEVSPWEYPPPEHAGYRAWNISRYERHAPWPARLLRLLWRDELIAVCGRLRIGMSLRADRSSLIAEILRLARCGEIESEVCRQLRRRAFAEADAPILDEAA